MYRKFVLIFLLVLVLPSCAALQTKPIEVSGKHYLDPNFPAISLDFPTNISIFKEDVTNTEHENIKTVKLRSSEEEIYIYIKKMRLTTSNYEYFNTDISNRKNKIIHEIKTNKGYAIYIREDNGTTYIVGEIIYPISRKEKIQVIASQVIDKVFSPEYWASINTERLEKFHDYIKFIYNQNIHASSDELSLTKKQPKETHSTKLTESSQETKFDEAMQAYKRKDYAFAFATWLLLADEGHAEAANQVGGMYSVGQGVKRDHKQSVHWYAVAAEYGHGEAQYKLANRYDDGVGVLRNPAEAYKWYWLCEQNKSTPYSMKLGAARMLRNYANNDVLSPGQVAHIEKLAQEWEPLKVETSYVSAPKSISKTKTKTKKSFFTNIFGKSTSGFRGEITKIYEPIILRLNPVREFETSIFMKTSSSGDVPSEVEETSCKQSVKRTTSKLVYDANCEMNGESIYIKMTYSPDGSIYLGSKISPPEFAQFFEGIEEEIFGNINLALNRPLKTGTSLEVDTSKIITNFKKNLPFSENNIEVNHKEVDQDYSVLGMSKYRGRDVLVFESHLQGELEIRLNNQSVLFPYETNGYGLHDLETGVVVGGNSTMEMSSSEDGVEINMEMEQSLISFTP